MTIRNFLRRANSSLIFLAIGLGIVCGIFASDAMISIRWVGEVFFNMLKMMAIPLIFTALVSSIELVDSVKKVGAMGKYVAGYVLLSVSAAASIALILFNTFEPGVGLNPEMILGAGENPRLERAPMTISGFLLHIFSPNIFASLVNFDVMAIMMFAVMFTAACLFVGPAARPVVHFFTSLKLVFMKMISWVIAISPIGIFSLIGAGVADSVRSGRLAEDFQGLSFFVMIFLSGLALQFLWQLVAIKIFTRFGAFFYLKNASKAIVTAFGTSSTLVTLPVSLEVLERAKIRDEVLRFVMPLTAAINLGATVMYEASAALFFSQILGYHLSLTDQIFIFIIAIGAGMGGSGLPESGIITMVTVMRALNIPVSAITLLLPLDRILDRFRTVVNTWGDICCTAVVDGLLAKEEARKSLKASSFAESREEVV